MKIFKNACAMVKSAKEKIKKLIYKRPLTVVSLFSGYDSGLMALQRASLSSLGLRFKLLLWSDIDPNAQKAHNILFPQYIKRLVSDVRNVLKVMMTTLKSISTIVDLLIYSPCCQSISRAGKRDGLKEGSGTQSSLIFYVKGIIRVLRPRVLLMENVAAMLDPQFHEDFVAWIRTVSSYGYTSYFKTMCSADYGVPQNRDRIIMVSLRNDQCLSGVPSFAWPDKVKDMPTPESFLSDIVDDRYYLTQEQQESFLDLIYNAKEGYTSEVKPKGEHPYRYMTSQFDRLITRYVSPLTKNGAVPTLMAEGNGGSMATISGCRRESCPCVIEVWSGKEGLLPLETTERNSTMKTTALRECKDRARIIETIDSLSSDQYLRVRHLTPGESLRLMGVDQTYIDRLVSPEDTLSEVGYTNEQISDLMVQRKNASLTDAHLYKLAGNSIVVDLLEAIFRQIFISQDSTVVQKLIAEGVVEVDNTEDEATMSPQELKRKKA